MGEATHKNMIADIRELLFKVSLNRNVAIKHVHDDGSKNYRITVSDIIVHIYSGEDSYSNDHELFWWIEGYAPTVEGRPPSPYQDAARDFDEEEQQEKQRKIQDLAAVIECIAPGLMSVYATPPIGVYSRECDRLAALIQL